MTNNQSSGVPMFVTMLLIGLLLLTIILIIVDMKNYNKISKECVGNPLVYGVQQYEKANNKSVDCVCSFAGTSEKFFVNDKEVIFSSDMNIYRG